MARFERPEGAIVSHADIQKWDVLWHVFGIWPPFMSGPEIVIRQPYRKATVDGIVFDTRKPRVKWVYSHHATDGNLLPDYSHNDNYWFRTEKEAEAARDWLRQQWEGNPDAAEDAA